jgi:hypothetical protein
METGARADEMVEEIMRSGEVAASRAATIARTETSRASSNLLQGAGYPRREPRISVAYQ